MVEKEKFTSSKHLNHHSELFVRARTTGGEKVVYIYVYKGRLKYGNLLTFQSIEVTF